MLNSTIRPYRAADLDMLYEICLKTGNEGDDASHLYHDVKALGYLYTAPYAIREPDLAFVLEDEAGVCGYILGAFDSSAFEEWLHETWYPQLRKTLKEPEGDPANFTPDERVYWQIFHPERNNAEILASYPSHLHIDLLPRAQGQGNGRRMMEAFLNALRDKGSKGVHLGLARNNERAFKFYRKLGFEVLEAPDLPKSVLFMGRLL